jgi:hypothetical protein
MRRSSLQRPSTRRCSTRRCSTRRCSTRRWNHRRWNRRCFQCCSMRRSGPQHPSTRRCSIRRRACSPAPHRRREVGPNRTRDTVWPDSGSSSRLLGKAASGLRGRSRRIRVSEALRARRRRHLIEPDSLSFRVTVSGLPRGKDRNARARPPSRAIIRPVGRFARWACARFSSTGSARPPLLIHHSLLDLPHARVHTAIVEPTPGHPERSAVCTRSKASRRARGDRGRVFENRRLSPNPAEPEPRGFGAPGSRPGLREKQFLEPGVWSQPFQNHLGRAPPPGPEGTRLRLRSRLKPAGAKLEFGHLWVWSLESLPSCVRLRPEGTNPAVPEPQRVARGFGPRASGQTLFSQAANQALPGVRGPGSEAPSLCHPAQDLAPKGLALAEGDVIIEVAQERAVAAGEPQAQLYPKDVGAIRVGGQVEVQTARR